MRPCNWGDALSASTQRKAAEAKSATEARTIVPLFIEADCVFGRRSSQQFSGTEPCGKQNSPDESGLLFVSLFRDRYCFGLVDCFADVFFVVVPPLAGPVVGPIVALVIGPMVALVMGPMVALVIGPMVALVIGPMVAPVVGPIVAPVSGPIVFCGCATFAGPAAPGAAPAPAPPGCWPMT